MNLLSENNENRTVFITGSTGTIGLACVQVFHELNYQLLLHTTNTSKLDQLSCIKGFDLNKHKVIVGDFSDMSGIIDQTNQHKKIDILICNAGIRKDYLSLNMSERNFMDVIDINLKSTFILNKICAKKMLKNKFGRIINIASVVGMVGNYGQSNYAASKAGIIGMTKTIAKELACKNITVNSISPGFIESNMTSNLTDEQKKSILSFIPAKTFGNALDVAYLAGFIASDYAGYITGQNLSINGGMI